MRVIQYKQFLQYEMNYFERNEIYLFDHLASALIKH